MKKNLPILLLLTLGIATRFLPHPANFTAVGAVALFGGLYLSRRWAIIMPLVAMVVSDIFLGFYTWQINLTVYAGFVIMGLIGLWAREHKSVGRILGGTIAGSIFYFLITNLSVWAFGAMYAHTLSGLLNCFYMALPFFRNSILGDICYVSALVGGYEAIVFLKSRAQLIAAKQV